MLLYTSSAKTQLLAALHAHAPLATLPLDFEVQGRAKGLVSTFRKVFRQNKQVEVR
jgi:(p)ppGpp synthase/HD superfamily hydrolase